MTIPDLERAALLAQIYGITLDSLTRTESVDGVGIALIPADFFESKIQELEKIIADGAS